MIVLICTSHLFWFRNVLFRHVAQLAPISNCWSLIRQKYCEAADSLDSFHRFSLNTNVYNLFVVNYIFLYLRMFWGFAGLHNITAQHQLIWKMCGGNSVELLCHPRHECHFLRLYRDCAALRAAGRIPESWTPCGRDMAITESNPSSTGTGYISAGLWVLVIGRWRVKPVVLVGNPRATFNLNWRPGDPVNSLLTIGNFSSW